MANILNAYNCLVDGGNTGVGQCPVDIGAIIGAILMPSTTSFATSTLASADAMAAALQLLTLSPKNTRIYPIHNLEQSNDGSEENTYETLAFGSQALVRRGKYDITYRFTKGAMCLYQQLFKFSGRTDLSVMFIDDRGLLFGMRVGDTFKGIPLELFDVPRIAMNTGSATTVYSAKFRYSQDFIKSFGFVQLGYTNWDSLTGLQALVISSAGARVAGVSPVRMNIGCGGTSDDFFDLYGTTISANPSLVLAKDSVSGNQLTVSSVGTDPNTKGFVVTISTADPDYVAGNKQVIYLTTPDLIAAAIPSLHVESNQFTTPN